MPECVCKPRRCEQDRIRNAGPVEVETLKGPGVPLHRKPSRPHTQLRQPELRPTENPPPRGTAGIQGIQERRALRSVKHLLDSGGIRRHGGTREPVEDRKMEESKRIFGDSAGRERVHIQKAELQTAHPAP